MAQPNHPWNMLPREPRGDSNPNTIYLAVGRALTTWERLEGRLAEAYAVMVGETNQAALRAYGTITGFRGRQNMLSAALEEFQPMMNSDLRRLHTKDISNVGQFSARRNEIAHGVVTALDPMKLPHVDRGRPEHFLLPAAYNSGKRHSWRYLRTESRAPRVDELGKYAYTGAQIDYYNEQFEQLIVYAGHFLAALRST